MRADTKKMTREMKPQTQIKSQAETFNFLISGSASGRTIVPFIGAGISAEVGMPPLGLLTEYLAKVQGYLHRRLFRFPNWTELRSFDSLGEHRGSLETTLRGPLRDYLLRSGWPDPAQLHTDLWHYLTYLPERNAPAHARRLQWLVHREALRRLKARDHRMATALREKFPDIDGEPSDQEPWRPAGSYWMDLLGGLTRADHDLVDSLFQRLAAGRKPGIVHRYLAFLVPVLRFRLFLTINFDPFLETALRMEGHEPEVFQVSEQAPLPHPSLLEEEVSVVKLHGSGYGLRVGESLNVPLDEENRRRFLEYLPKRLILLVMGIGGGDERVLDMIELVRRRRGDVVWLHFDDDGVPQTVGARFRALDPGHESAEVGGLHSCRVRHPGAFVEELYLRYKGAHPASRHGYRPYPPRPILSVPVGKSSIRPVCDRFSREWITPPLQVFEDEVSELGFGGARLLSELVSDLAGTHHPVWIDLDGYRTVPEVVLELVRQIRVFDPDIAPEIVPATFAGQDTKKACRRLLGAFGRGRYVIAFNRVESFGRRHFDHHGGESDVVEEGLQFFEQLLLRAFESPPICSGGKRLGRKAFRLRDSVLAFSVRGTPFANRLRDAPGRPTAYRPAWHVESLAVSSADIRDLNRLEEATLYRLAILCAFRRRRSLALLDRVHQRFFESPRPGEGTGDTRPTAWERIATIEENLRSALDEVLGKADVHRQVLANVEGGYLWLSQSFRNDLFGRISKSERPETLLNLAAIHREIATHYARDLYRLSGGISVLLEHFYHRVESTRFLLQAMDVDRAPGAEADGLGRALGRLGFPTLGAEPGVETRFRVARLCRDELAALVDSLSNTRGRLLVRMASQSLLRWLEDLSSVIVELDEKSHLGGVATGFDRVRDSWSRTVRGACSLIEEIEIDVHLDQLTVEDVESVWRKRLVDRTTMRDQIRSQLDLAEVSIRAGNLRRCQEALSRASDLLGSDGADMVEEEGDERSPRELMDLSAEVLRLDADAWLAGKPDPAKSRFEKPALIDPWDTKGSGLKRLARQEMAAQQALASSRQGLARLDRVPARTSSETLRSLLLSTLGRSCCLLGRWSDSYEAYESARAVLSHDVGARDGDARDALLGSFLGHAECMMLYADRAVVDACLQRLSNHDAEEGDEAPMAYEERVLAQLSLSNLDPETLRVRCEAAPPGHRVDPVDRPTMAATVRSRLAHAGDLLDQAHLLLEDGRRRIDRWATLFQLQAQLQVERLLWMTLVGWADPSKSFPEAVSDHLDGRGGDIGAYSRWVALLTRTVRDGIDAVRKGLDIVLPDDSLRNPGDLSADRFVMRFLRLWSELLIAATYLRVQLISKEPVERFGEGPRAWEPRSKLLRESWMRWERINHQAGLERLPQAQEFQKAFEATVVKWCPAEGKDASDAVRVRPPGLSARAEVLSWIDRSVTRKERASLVRSLCRDTGGDGVQAPHHPSQSP